MSNWHLLALLRHDKKPGGFHNNPISHAIINAHPTPDMHNAQCAAIANMINLKHFPHIVWRTIKPVPNDVWCRIHSFAICHAAVRLHNNNSTAKDRMSSNGEVFAFSFLVLAGFHVYVIYVCVLVSARVFDIVRLLLTMNDKETYYIQFNWCNSVFGFT